MPFLGAGVKHGCAVLLRPLHGLRDKLAGLAGYGHSDVTPVTLAEAYALSAGKRDRSFTFGPLLQPKWTETCGAPNDPAARWPLGGKPVPLATLWR